MLNIEDREALNFYMTKIKPILFCDFDGVLCHDQHWRSLPPKKYEKARELLFQNDAILLNDWLRGKYTSEEINRIVSEKIHISFEKLWDIFVKDCKTMRVSKDALEALNRLRDRYTVILVTGNMDSFKRFTQPTLALDKYFDHISISYYEGTHKTDDRGKLFIKYANKYGVSIQNCILFDDSTKVQKVFAELGGTVYLVTPDQNLLYHLKNLFDRDASVGHRQNRPKYP